MANLRSVDDGASLRDCLYHWNLPIYEMGLAVVGSRANKLVRPLTTYSVTNVMNLHLELVRAKLGLQPAQ